MNNTTEVLKRIEELSEELKRLHLAQTEVNNRILVVSQELKNISTGSTRVKSEDTKYKATKTRQRVERKISLEECRASVGKHVRIVNPKNLQECFGRIIKVGTLYVTIELPNGEHKRRIASNIRIIEDE